MQETGAGLVYDTCGDPAAPPLLLVAGFGQQLVSWDDAFCAQLAARGYYVVRFDNRDVGLSPKYDTAGVPDIGAVLQARKQGKTVPVPYRLDDMAQDAVSVLDALEIPAAHVVGVSMGGMIGQLMAIRYPQRVRTLTSIMSTTSAPDLPPARPEAWAILLTPLPPDLDGYCRRSVRNWGVLGGSAFPMDEADVRDKAEQAYRRGLHPAGTARQMAAILAADSRRDPLRSVTVPTLVIHGDADPLVPVECGIDTAEAIPGAKLLVMEGMGHALPPPVWPEVLDAIERHAR